MISCDLIVCNHKIIKLKYGVSLPNRHKKPKKCAAANNNFVSVKNFPERYLFYLIKCLVVLTINVMILALIHRNVSFISLILKHRYLQYPTPLRENMSCTVLCWNIHEEYMNIMCVSLNLDFIKY